MRTSAENHRLILNHMYLVPMLASGFRGAKGIPFDELEGEGVIGLVKAASAWREPGDFVRFANTLIRNQIIDFIRAWEAPPTAEEQEASAASDPITEVYIWQTWSDRDFVNALAERWEFLCNSPAELSDQYEQIKLASSAIRAGMIGFSRRDRAIITARYFSDPPSTIDTIARQHKISYARAVFLINRMLNRIKDIYESYEAATPIAKRG